MVLGRESKGFVVLLSLLGVAKAYAGRTTSHRDVSSVALALPGEGLRSAFSLLSSVPHTFPIPIDSCSERIDLIYQIISATAINAQDLYAHGPGVSREEG